MYLDAFSLPDEREETGYIISCGKEAYKSFMSCYPKDLYPFKIFPQKRLSRLTFEPITLLYRGEAGLGARVSPQPHPVF